MKNVNTIATLNDAKEVIVDMLIYFREELLNTDSDRYFTVAEEVYSAKEILLDANRDTLTEEQKDLIERA